MNKLSELSKPVAWEVRFWNSGHHCWHDWARITAKQHAEMSVKYATDNDYEFRVLYDAPPAPLSTNPSDWGIDKSTGTPILVYKNCSVIESEQAEYVLSLINNAATPAVPDGWVACSERMPEPNKNVLVSNGVWVGIGMYNDAENFEDDERWQDEHHEFIDLLHHPVTHWMPLSAPPQEA